MTLVVLGIDALDAAQVDHFDAGEFRLTTHGEMETFAHQNPIPHTGEVWPTVATGLHPEEHGITEGGESKWDSMWVELLSRAAGPFFHMRTRAKVGRLISSLTGAEWELNEVDDPTLFDGDGRYVHNWPGTINGNEVQKIWRHINHTAKQGAPQGEFDRELFALECQKFAWVEEMLNHDAVLVGTHVHLLDASGHAYGYNEDHYEYFYRRCENFVAAVKDAMDDDDELLILSDHGMNTTWLPNDYKGGGSDAGHHSFRAFSASTTETRPESVFDVKDWVEENVGPHERSYEGDAGEDVEFDEDHLRELGYIQ